ncbi:MAG: hypothetical protein NVS4B2_23040 [Chloroflexota bacterium]
MGTGIAATPVDAGICGYEDGNNPRAARSNDVAIDHGVGTVQARALGRSMATQDTAIKNMMQYRMSDRSTLRPAPRERSNMTRA